MPRADDDTEYIGGEARLFTARAVDAAGIPSPAGWAYIPPGRP